MKRLNISPVRPALRAQTTRVSPACRHGRARHPVHAVALLLGCAIAAGFLVGCQSTSPSQYISPRVEGRVLDAQTQQPLAGVKVRRVVPASAPAVGQVPKGDATLEQTPAVRSHPDGTFVLASQRDLTLFRHTGWYSVTIAFEHAGYLPLTKEYTLGNATNTPAGEPLVKAGDILLAPRSK